MSFTAAGIAYILKKTGYDEEVKQGWLGIQQERAERDFLEALESEGPSKLENLEQRLEKDSKASQILEPGYKERIEELFEEYKDSL